MTLILNAEKKLLNSLTRFLVFVAEGDNRRKMKETTLNLLVCAIAFGILFTVSTSSAFAQSQALNGQIEGTVLDQNKAAVPNALVTVTNIETGASRRVTTDESGVYRFPLLPLGTYLITAEAPNFKKLVREGITLATGQIATVDLNLDAGEVQETVIVSSDTSVADAGKTDLGRVMNTREVQNLPLVSRNPNNFALLQANVSGRRFPNFNFPTVNANGYARRINYQLDGNTNTQADRSGVPLIGVSETYVSEVQLVTNGFAAEFGNTPGLIINVVTPSGTNKIRGAVSYRLARTPFFARPFFYDSPNDLPKNNSDNLTARIGAPIIRDRWHFYFGYEWIDRDDNISRLVTITPADGARLISAGLSPSIFPPTIPSFQKAAFYIFRTDAQLNERNRLTGRFNYGGNLNKNFLAVAALNNTLDRGFDLNAPNYSLGLQLASVTPKVLNELRFQYAWRRVGTQRNEDSGTGPSIVISNVANFGSPDNVDTIGPREIVTQIQDNLTWTKGMHSVKFGGGFNFIDDFIRAAVFSRYTFPTIDAYLEAKGTNLRSYSFYEETSGDPETAYRSTFWNFFVQDDWKVTRRLKFSIGVRYDLYRIPEADSNAPFPASRRFKVDKDNFAPRLGVVYTLREGKHPTILRAGAGIYYETPWLNMYERALRINGNPSFLSFKIFPDDASAPLFPNTLGSFPPGTALPRPNVDTIAPDLETMYAIHSHLQVEQAITENLSFTIGYIHSAGRHLAVYRNINPIGVVRYLADGRAVFSDTVSAATRLDPRFNVIQMAESAGVSRYDALTLQLTKRFSRGLQFSANYTLSKATDDAPEQNLGRIVQGLVVSDPNNRRFDKGYSLADQRHTFVMSLVARPQFDFENKTLRYLFSHNQVGIIANANSGETFDMIAGLDLNRDGVSTSDRPVGIKRNAGKTPPQFNVDLRYSRFFNFTERYRLEVFGEFQNLFNVNSIVQFNNVTVTTNPTTGELVGGLPDFRARNQSTAQESRQFQLGFKFMF